MWSGVGEIHITTINLESRRARKVIQQEIHSIIKRPRTGYVAIQLVPQLGSI